MKKLLPSFIFKLSTEGSYLEIASLYLSFFNSLQMDQRAQEINEIIAKKLFNRIPFLCKMIKIIIFMSRNSFQTQIKSLFFQIDQLLGKGGRREDGRKTGGGLEEGGRRGGGGRKEVKRVGGWMEEGERGGRREEGGLEESWRRVGVGLPEGGRRKGGGETEEGKRDFGGLIIFRKVIYGRNIEMLKSDGFRANRKLTEVGGFKSEQNMGRVEKNILSESHLVSEKLN